MLYDYYIEPCQLCIARNGSTHDICGWCNDRDTFYKKRDIYAGNYIKLSYGGNGYPYHEIPHITRRYYKDDVHLEKFDAKTPPDISDEDIAVAHARNEASARLLNSLETGEVSTNMLSELDDTFETYAKKYQAILDNKLNFENCKENISAAIEMNSLAIDFGKIDGLSEMLDKVKSLLNDTKQHSEDIKSFVLSNMESIKLLELANHEFFHLFQSLQYHSCGVLYDSFRRILDFRLNVLVNYIQLGGLVDIGKDGNILSLLLKTEEIDEESFENLSNWFNLIKKPIDCINYFFTSKSNNSELRVIDLVEGQAYGFQKLKTMEIDTFDFDNNSVYKKAFAYFANKHEYQDEMLFLIFCHFSLKYGYVEHDSLSDTFPNPVDIFEYLCSKANEFCIELDDNRPRFFSSDPVSILNNLGVNTDKYVQNSKIDLKNLVSGLSEEKLYLLAKVLGVMYEIEKTVIEYFEAKNIKFKDYKYNCCNTNRFHDSKIRSLHKIIGNITTLFNDDIFFVVALLRNELLVETIHKPLINLTFDSFFGNILDSTTDRAFSTFVDDFENFMDGQKGVYCCTRHGTSNNTRNILKQNEEDCFSNRFELVFGIPLHSVLVKE